MRVFRPKINTICGSSRIYAGILATLGMTVIKHSKKNYHFLKLQCWEKLNNFGFLILLLFGVLVACVYCDVCVRGVSWVDGNSDHLLVRCRELDLEHNALRHSTPSCTEAYSNGGWVKDGRTGGRLDWWMDGLMDGRGWQVDVWFVRWSQLMSSLFPKNIRSLRKLDGVGPVDNRPSTGELHQ